MAPATSKKNLVAVITVLSARYDMRKPTLKFALCFWLCIGLTVIAARPTEANSTLVITETSSSSLTATLDGTALSITNDSPDHWTIHFPFAISIRDLASFWDEPELPFPSSQNYLFTPVQNPSTAIFESDIFPVGGPNNPNGSTVAFGAFEVSSPNTFIDVTVTDHGDVAQVPEPSPLMMLSVALLGVGIFGRKAFTWRREFRT